MHRKGKKNKTKNTFFIGIKTDIYFYLLTLWLFLSLPFFFIFLPYGTTEVRNNLASLPADFKTFHWYFHRIIWKPQKILIVSS